MNVMQNMYSERFLKDSVKPLRSPFSVILQTFFTQKGFKGHLFTQRVLKALKHLRGLALKGHLVTMYLDS